MEHDRIKWNAKYRQGAVPREPSAIVRRFAGLPAGRRALDLAAGSGRNSVFLAQQGFQVDAVDISEEGLQQIPALPEIRRVCTDLDRCDIAAGRYDLIVDLLYVNRRLFPQLHEGLRPGGVLIFESLLFDPDQSSGHCRDYYLRENELLHAFLGLRIVYYREGPEEQADTPRRLASLVGIRV